MKINSLASILACVGLLLSTGAESKDNFSPFYAQTFVEIKNSMKGQPFVLSLWSIDCAPCRVELDLLGDIVRQNPAFPLIIVSTDSIENRETANIILEDYGLDSYQTWMFADNFSEKLRFSIDPSWFGELPRSYAFDKNHRATAHSGILSQDKLNEFLELINLPIINRNQ